MHLEYDEKRAFRRCPIVCRLTYRPAGGGPCSEGEGIDLSGSGILFVGETSLKIGKAVEVNLLSENRLTPPLTVYIEVVRCEQGKNGCYTLAGAIKGIKSIS